VQLSGWNVMSTSSWKTGTAPASAERPRFEKPCADAECCAGRRFVGAWRITVNDFKGAFRFDVASRTLPFQTTIICTRYRTRTFSLSRDPACARILSRSSREIEFGAGLHDMARVSNEGLAAWERLYGGATA
jgi:hypothetical protein